MSVAAVVDFSRSSAEQDVAATPSSALSAATSSAAQRAYPAPAETPTQAGPAGLRYDFNDGGRLLLPAGDHPWKVRLSDIDTGNILFETELVSGRVNSAKRYFVRIRLDV